MGRAWIAAVAHAVLAMGCGRVGYDPVSTDGGAPPDAKCTPPPANSPIGEWRADGTLDNDVACAPVQLAMAGSVPYGPGREGQAWRFRSTSTGEDDRNYLGLRSPVAVRLRAFTVDVWVLQTHFNAFAGSNRAVLTTRWSRIHGPEAVSVYLHENGNYYFLVHTGAGTQRGVDWETCALSTSNAALQRGTWVRFTATYDGQRLACYEDAMLRDSNLLRDVGDGVDLAPDLVIGRNFPGDIDGIRIFARALSAAEIAASR